MWNKILLATKTADAETTVFEICSFPNRGFLCETKGHLPRKVTSIFWLPSAFTEHTSLSLGNFCRFIVMSKSRIPTLHFIFLMSPFWSFERKTYTWSSRKSSHSMKSGGFHMDFIRISGEIRRISPWNPWNPADFRWNPADFMKSVKSGGFQVKSGRFHPDITCEIHPKL